MYDWSTVTIGIATKHQKERVLAPLITRSLGATVVHLSFDTDRFGTFSGEVPRPGDQLATLKAKASAAASATGHTFVVASEGAVSGHPLISGAGLSRELVTLYDVRADVFVLGQHTGALPQVHSAKARNVTELTAALSRFDLPTHQILLKNHPTKPSAIIKDIDSEAELITSAKALLRWPWQQVYLETDVRADRHPERMALIEKAGEDLMENLLRACPQCSRGGFSPTKTTPGLSCSACGTPTDVAKSTGYRCPYCNHEEEVPSEAAGADPADCPHCNP